MQGAADRTLHNRQDQISKEAHDRRILDAAKPQVRLRKRHRQTRALFEPVDVSGSLPEDQRLAHTQPVRHGAIGESEVRRHTLDSTPDEEYAHKRSLGPVVEESVSDTGILAEGIESKGFARDTDPGAHPP